MEKRWRIVEAPAEIAEGLRKSLGVNASICKILAQRGITNFDEARNFFRPKMSMLHNPMLMKDMEKAVARVVKALTAGEKILVFGDYDVDGTTSVALMFSFLKNICAPGSIDFYIPHRYREGYGVSLAGIEFAAKNNFTLIIALDCGIKSVELISHAKQAGIDFIVCDHHLPGNELPPAVAILNAKQADCNYPYKELCGCGVGYKLIQALGAHYEMPAEATEKYLDLVATAIAADIVPMTGENRVLAYFGLQRINTQPLPGIEALIKLASCKLPLSITNVVFVIAPRINAAGRMDEARKAVQLFIEQDAEKALEFAEMLHTDNSDRKLEDRSTTIEALEMMREDPDLDSKKTTVVFKDSWHKGVVGIVASRLIESYHRPTIVLTKSGDFVAGSARSVPGFNLYEAIYACKQHLVTFGGHFAAAGLTMKPEQVNAFKQSFEDAVAGTIEDALLVPELVIDAVIDFSEIKKSFYNIICQMEPFGPENLRPVFLTRGVCDTGYSRIVKEQHVKFSLEHNGIVKEGIGFFLSEKFELLSQKHKVDVVYTIDENDWNGNTTLQLKLIDIRLHEEEMKNIINQVDV